MSELSWILSGGLLMSLIAMVGSVTTMLPPSRLEQLLLPLVALAAGSLLGGAMFHMIPQGLAGCSPVVGGWWLATGFLSFLALEQFLLWHQSHDPQSTRPAAVAWLILLGDALHNLLGGLAIAGTFLTSAPAGIAAWVAAAAHEVPQELGDFGVLVHSGWSPRAALLANFVSALTFPLGGLLAYAVATRMNVAGLALFGAGNFLYIAASDLIPEIKSKTSGWRAGLHLLMVVAGIALVAAFC